MNQIFLDKAGQLMPILQKSTVYPLTNTEPNREEPLRFREFTLDFGTHLVGYFTLKVKTDPTPDSPLKIRLFFAEMPFEGEPGEYKGHLSSSWIQREEITVDNPLEPIRLPRRYAFRYVTVCFPCNTGYQMWYESAFTETVTSADISRVPELKTENALLREIDEVAQRTLRDCMQTFFEDGPKRDRRLWLGDLYLQAKANYLTFRNYDLVRRCLYLFAGLPHPDGTLSSAVYAEPVLRNQAWIIHDYALFFGGTLADYYDETGDMDFLRELWPTAFRQAEIVGSSILENGLLPVEMYFVDWCEPLDKTCAALGTVITMLKRHLYLAGIVGTEEQSAQLQGWIDRLTVSALKLYDREKHLFFSEQEKAEGVCSVASQMWMVLADILDAEEERKVLSALDAVDNRLETVTPYARHYYVQALLNCGMKDRALQVIEEYWGAMVRMGADCFWEVFVPGDEFASPYGDRRINSYCHAWSCTPTYFIRKYFAE